jgi:hypothetical protein
MRIEGLGLGIRFTNLLRARKIPTIDKLLDVLGGIRKSFESTGGTTITLIASLRMAFFGTFGRDSRRMRSTGRFPLRR